jgi:hypothetical protein
MKLPSIRQFIFILVASVLLGHFFISLGRTDTIVDLLSQSWYYLDLFFVTAIVFTITSFVAIVHYSLDARHPITAGMPKRFMLQTLIGIVVPAFLCFVLTFMYMELVLDQEISDTSFLLYEFPIAIVIIFAINLVFVVITLLQNNPSPAKGTRSVLVVNQGDKNFRCRSATSPVFQKRATTRSSIPSINSNMSVP